MEGERGGGEEREVVGFREEGRVRDCFEKGRERDKRMVLRGRKEGKREREVVLKRREERRNGFRERRRKERRERRMVEERKRRLF